MRVLFVISTFYKVRYGKGYIQALYHNLVTKTHVCYRDAGIPSFEQVYKYIYPFYKAMYLYSFVLVDNPYIASIRRIPRLYRNLILSPLALSLIHCTIIRTVVAESFKSITCVRKA